MKNNKTFSYDHKIVEKPWGNEYVIYRNLNKISVTFLNINYNKSTSLHCHPKKKTGFIVLSGNALIQLGLWKGTAEKYNAPSKLMIRSGLFHSIKATSKKGLCAIEIETPVNKNDLVRFKDNFGREQKPYEGKEFTKKTSKNNVFFKKTKKKILQKYIFDSKVELSLEIHNNFKKINKEKMQTIFAILDGKIINKLNRSVMSVGDIIKTGTLKKLSEVFKIKKNLTVLKVKKI
jgi:mannose-6-phosphate isomerase-like protein (cupin superfamily)